jgi:hypothetical protein
MDLLTTYTHHSELQVITLPLLISTLYKPFLQTLNLLQPTVSSTAILWKPMLTAEILQLPMLNSPEPAWGPWYIALGQTQQKALLSTVPPLLLWVVD